MGSTLREWYAQHNRVGHGDVSIYLSSFISFAAKPPSKVGALVYTNNTSDLNSWVRPDANLFWYNPNGTTSDDKISYEPGPGYKSTNIVAVDIESVGMYDAHYLSKNGIKLIYLPQRESHNSIISGYEMNKDFETNGVLSGFSSMKFDRERKQFNYTFDFINGDTHMGYLWHDSIYSFVSRLNAKRSSLKQGETLPLRPDARKRYRRETYTPIGKQLVSEHVDLNIALDMSTPQWEPYSMQPMQLPEFEDDIWWGLVTMFGTEGDPTVQHKQRTELAISNDGRNWRYLKPGTPFLNNGTSPNSDDYGCINISLPVWNTNFSSNPNDLYYFYASSNQRHVTGRNPGVSVAIGKSGKWAGLKVGGTAKEFLSPIMKYRPSDMPSYSLYYALYLGSESFPRLLADVTEDPTGKYISNINSYSALLIYAFDASTTSGMGAPLAASFGAPQKGTTQPSENYESIPFTVNGTNGNSKQLLFTYLKQQSDANPTKVISVKEMAPVPVVIRGMVKNSTFYGISFKKGNQDIPVPLDLSNISNYDPTNLWTYNNTTPVATHTEVFSNKKLQPNEVTPVNRTTGTIAISATPVQSSKVQTILRMYGDDTNNNYLSIDYEANGNIVYTLQKDGIPFAQMTAEPPTGKSFNNHDVTILLEVVPHTHRKYDTGSTYDVAVLTVKCPDLQYEKSVPQPILWNWKHPEGSITDSDKANAQAFAFLEFSSFAPSLTTLTVGASNSTGTQEFDGTIKKVQVANTLPLGASDFWE